MCIGLVGEMIMSKLERVVSELIEKYGLETSEKIGRMLLERIERTKRKETPPEIKFGRPRYIKALVKGLVSSKVLSMEEAWKILNEQFRLEDKNRNLTRSLLDWNPDIFDRASERRGDYRWKLTTVGEELASKFSDEIDLSTVEKTILSGFYLNDEYTRIVYTIFKGGNKTRGQGMKEFVGITGESEKHSEWFIGEKTTSLVDLGLLERERGRRTIYR